MAEDFCRLCLRPVDKANCAEIKKDEAKQEMFSEFFPELNIDLSANPTLCNECALNLEVSSNFKQGVLENEARIESELAKSKSKAKKKKIDLKTLLDAETKNELKSDLSICRTCLAICKDPSIRLYEAKTNVMPYSFVKKMCVQIFELEFTNSDKPVMCDECWETLQNAYDFRKNCLKTEKKITSYCQENKLTILGEIDLKKLNSLPANEDDSEMSDDDDFGDVDIKEEIFDPNDPDLSNPGSSSSSLQHVKLKKEEDGASGSVSVKSESGMDDEDEDMGDHPDLVDPNNLKSEEDGEGDDIDTKMEVGDTVKVDPEAAGAAGPSGFKKHEATSRNQTSNVFRHKQKPKIHERKLDSKMHIQKLSCEQCSYQTHFPSGLKRHLLVHAAQKTDAVQVFECNECNYKVNRKDNLKKHIISVHAAPNPFLVFECKVCKYNEERKGCLNAHINHTHRTPSAIQAFECNGCTYKTNHRGRLKEHIMRIHVAPETVPVYECNECLYKTKLKCDLKMHIKRIHATLDETIQFECNECIYKTRRKDVLQKHVKNVHTARNEVLEFECNMCSYIGKRKRYLKAHMKRMHATADSEASSHVAARSALVFASSHSLFGKEVNAPTS